MNKKLENLLITIEKVKFQNEIQQFKMINGYWCEMVLYNGEKKERYKFMGPKSEVKRIYEKIFETHDLVKNVSKFINVRQLNVKCDFNDEKATWVHFIGIKKKDLGKVEVVECRKPKNEDELFTELYRIENMQEIVSGGINETDELSDKNVVLKKISKKRFHPQQEGFEKRAIVPEIME